MKRLFILSLAFLFFCSCAEKQPKPKKSITNRFYDKAFEYKENGIADSAFLFFNLAKDLFLEQKDSLGAGKCLVNMGILATNKGDYFGGQELSLNALSFFDKSNKKHRTYIKSNYNNLGLASYRLKDDENAIKFYDLAIKFSDDTLDTRTYQNNKGNSYRELKRYDEALKMYLLAIQGISQNQEEYARVLTNLAFLKWLQNPGYNAAPDLLKALHLREKENDLLGQNSSFAHLSDYYKAKQPDSALNYAIKMYKVADKANSPDDELEALQKIIKLSHPNNIKQYFENYLEIADSLENSRNIAKNQFTLIRFDAEKNKADYLKAQADNAEKQNSILRRNIALGLLILSLILGYFLFRKRQKRLKQEKDLEIKNTELKYVRKVHDRVANKVYSVMMEVENTDNLNRTLLADKLEVIYEISRDISYENNDVDRKLPFSYQLALMFNAYMSDVIEIKIDGNDDELWLGTNEFTRSEVINILQELMTNMKKHSQATEVQLIFNRLENKISIIYIDNGIGMGNKPIYKNGLNNTGNRIAEINGTINFDTTVPKGLRIEIYFPVF